MCQLVIGAQVPAVDTLESSKIQSVVDTLGGRGFGCGKDGPKITLG